jgi:hypothetical protein
MMGFITGKLQIVCCSIPMNMGFGRSNFYQGILGVKTKRIASRLVHFNSSSAFEDGMMVGLAFQ